MSKDGNVSHLGYEYSTVYDLDVRTWSDGCDSQTETWDTYRSKSNGTGEKLLFCTTTEENGPYYHKVKTEYYNLNKILATVMSEYGHDVLLGDLTDYFPSFDFAESKEKCIIYRVHKLGAADILKNDLQSSNEEKEASAQKAIEHLIKGGVQKGHAKAIINDFIYALGWKLTESDIAKAIQQKKKRKIQFGKYLWRVLDVQDGKVLLITEDIIDMRTYNKGFDDVTWEISAIRKYLNGEFLENNFSEEQIEKIIETEIPNHDNIWYGTKGGNDTKDKIFLLSLEEADKYFGNSGDYLNKRRKDNVNTFYGEDRKGLLFVSNEHNSERQAEYMKEERGWWLRSPGNKSTNVAIVDSDGSVHVRGFTVCYVFNFGGIRPALWLNYN